MKCVRIKKDLLLFKRESLYICTLQTMRGRQIGSIPTVFRSIGLCLILILLLLLLLFAVAVVCF